MGRLTPKLQAIIAAATPQITSDEGFRAVAYLDTAKPPNWTYGYGETGHGAGPGATCTIAQARQWRDERIAENADNLCIHIPWWVNLDVQRAGALLNQSYQLGVRGLLNFKKMLAALQAHDWHTAAAEALNSAWATQTPQRAKRIASVYLNAPNGAAPPTVVDGPVEFT